MAAVRPTGKINISPNNPDNPENVIMLVIRASMMVASVIKFIREVLRWLLRAIMMDTY